MLTLVIPPTEGWDEENKEFINSKEQILQLEHSLVSISKWESKWCKPFLGKEIKTESENLDYVRCMTLTQNVDQKVYSLLTSAHYAKINEYIKAPATATQFSNNVQGKKSNEQTTSEMIYYWMISLTIPFECQKWHLNRLLTLIRICNIKNQPPKKRSKGEILSQNAALNAARRQQQNTKG